MKKYLTRKIRKKYRKYRRNIKGYLTEQEWFTYLYELCLKHLPEEWMWKQIPIERGVTVLVYKYGYTKVQKDRAKKEETKRYKNFKWE